MNTYTDSRGTAYYTARDGSRRRVTDQDRHRLTKRQKKAQKRGRRKA